MAQQASTSGRVTRPVARFVAIGLLLMAFFTALWAAWMPYGLRDAAGVVIVIVFVTLSVVFAVNGIALLRSGARFPLPTPEEASGRGRTLRIGFGVVFASEGVVIGAVCALLGANGGSDYFGPVIALIVGLHFIPFGFLFRRSIDFYIGGWVAFWATAGIWAIAAGMITPPLVASVVAIATAVGTTTYGLYFLQIKKSISQVPADPLATSAAISGGPRA